MTKEKMPKNFYVQYRGRSGKGKLGRLRNSKWFTLGEAIEFAKEKQDGYTISNIVRASVNPLKSNNHEHHLYGYIDKKKDLILEREGIPFSIYRCSNCSARNSDSDISCSECNFSLPPVEYREYEPTKVGRNIEEGIKMIDRRFEVEQILHILETEPIFYNNAHPLYHEGYVFEFDIAKELDYHWKFKNPVPSATVINNAVKIWKRNLQKAK